MQIREWPKALKAGNRVIPMFSLSAEQSRADPLLMQMIRKSGLSTSDFLIRKIMQPVLRQAAYLYFRHGIVGEPHGQNLLIEIDPHGIPNGRFWYRDFGGFALDKKVRASAGKGMKDLPEPLRNADLSTRYDDYIKDVSTYFQQGNLYAMIESL